MEMALSDWAGTCRQLVFLEKRTKVYRNTGMVGAMRSPMYSSKEVMIWFRFSNVTRKAQWCWTLGGFQLYMTSPAVASVSERIVLASKKSFFESNVGPNKTIPLKSIGGRPQKTTLLAFTEAMTTLESMIPPPTLSIYSNGSLQRCMMLRETRSCSSTNQKTLRTFHPSQMNKIATRKCVPQTVT